MTYKLTADTKIVQRLRDSAFIPVDLNNADYLEFLKWKTGGGVPEVADAPPIPNPRTVLDESESIAAKADPQLIALLNMNKNAVATEIDTAFTDANQRIIIKRLMSLAIIAARKVLR